MEYLRGWRALRQDPEWIKKVAIGSLLIFSGIIIPIVGQVALAGWLALALRRAVSGQDAPMPRLDFDFNYLGKLLGVGFKAFLARLIWSLPIIAVAMLFGCCMYMGIIGSAVGASEASRAGGEGGAAAGGVAMMIVMLVGMPLYFISIIVLSLPVIVATMRAELTDDLNSAMRFREVLSMTRLMMKELLIGSFVLSLIAVPLLFIGALCCYVGAFPAAVVVSVIQTYWLAEVYKAYLQKGGPPLQIGALDVEGGNLGQPAPPQF